MTCPRSHREDVTRLGLRPTSAGLPDPSSPPPLSYKRDPPRQTQISTCGSLAGLVVDFMIEQAFVQ